MKFNDFLSEMQKVKTESDVVVSLNFEAVQRTFQRLDSYRNEIRTCSDIDRLEEIKGDLLSIKSWLLCARIKSNPEERKELLKLIEVFLDNFDFYISSAKKRNIKKPQKTFSDFLHCSDEVKSKVINEIKGFNIDKPKKAAELISSLIKKGYLDKNFYYRSAPDSNKGLYNAMRFEFGDFGTDSGVNMQLGEHTKASYELS